jgi:nickel/cobalt transporter (NicO) family protein
MILGEADSASPSPACSSRHGRDKPGHDVFKAAQTLRDPPRRSTFRIGAPLALVAIVLLFAADPALAQFAHRPFAVAGGEGGGQATGITGWILAEQAQLVHLMTGWMKALHGDPSALWGLVGLSFLYGVVHAAGPGHGKALIASYMLANERALRRGIILAFLAALLQAFVAIALVGIAALVFRATSTEMNNAAFVVEMASYGAIAAVGAWLVWVKGRALAAALRTNFAHRAALAGGALYAEAPWRPAFALGSGQFRAVSPGGDQTLEAECGHVHAPDPSQLGDSFSWRSAAATVFAAGARPCSGAILVLVFALAQGIFLAGIGSTFAMAFGTAVTTGALAVLAVFAKDVALRFVRHESSLAGVIARAFEFAAALAVLAFGVLLLLGFGTSIGGA